MDTLKKEENHVAVIGARAERALREHRPLYIKLTPEFISEARGWLRQNIGYEAESRLFDKQAVEMYLTN